MTTPPTIGSHPYRALNRKLNQLVQKISKGYSDRLIPIANPNSAGQHISSLFVLYSLNDI